MSEGWLLAFSLVDGLCLLFLSVHSIITLSDLECDYINAKICCSKLNLCVIPEIVAHVILMLAVLIAGHWLLFLLNVPLLAWHLYRYLLKPSGNLGVFDPAEIYNRHLLKSYMKESLVKLGYHLVFFFLYLYSMIVAMIS
jgi:hypothetical protein